MACAALPPPRQPLGNKLGADRSTNSRDDAELAPVNVFVAPVALQREGIFREQYRQSFGGTGGKRAFPRAPAMDFRSVDIRDADRLAFIKECISVDDIDQVACAHPPTAWESRSKRRLLGFGAADRRSFLPPQYLPGPTCLAIWIGGRSGGKLLLRRLGQAEAASAPHCISETKEQARQDCKPKVARVERPRRAPPLSRLRPAPPRRRLASRAKGSWIPMLRHVGNLAADPLTIGERRRAIGSASMCVRSRP